MFDSLSVQRLTGCVARSSPVLVILAMTSLAMPRATAQGLTQRWLKTYGDFLSHGDTGDFVKIAPDGSVVMAFPSPDGNTDYDIHTAKYDGSTGAVLWERHSQTITNSTDRVCDMALDSAGNVILVGEREVYQSGQGEFYVVKYAAADGAVLWEHAFTPESRFFAVALTSHDNVIATGVHGNGLSPVTSEIDTYKFDGATGVILWKNVYAPPGTQAYSTNGSAALALDSNGNAYVTGYGDDNGSPQAVILKIESSGGITQWTAQHAIPESSRSTGEDVVVDAAGDAIVAISTPLGDSGLRVVKFRGSDGTELWTSTQNGGHDRISALALDSKGDVAVTGSVDDGPDQHVDIFTRKLSGADGQTIWAQTYDGGLPSDSSGTDVGCAVCFDRFDNAVVAGSSDGAAHTGPNTVVLKYAGVDGATLLQQRVAVEYNNGAPTGKHSLAAGRGYIAIAGYVSTLEGRKNFLLQMTDPATATTLAEWRSAHFGTVEDVGDAADLADPDHDGVTNLAEYAFHRDPLKLGQGSLPVAQAQADRLAIEFAEPIDVVGVTYGASMAATLAGPWQPLLDEEVTPLHRFHIPINQSQGFMRLEIGHSP